MKLNTRSIPKLNQYSLAVILVAVTSILCGLANEVIGYKVVALLLLMVVSVLAMLLDIIPVLISAVLSALIWNFFFIPPIYTFRIDNAEDGLLFSMYFILVLVNAVLTFKIRDAEKKARDKEEKENSIQLYNTLLNSLSHELRTPIATILGSVDTLKENNERLSKESQEELLGEIEKASIRLNRQVENLLNMSRLETGMLKVKLDWCDLNDLISSLVRKFSLASPNHTIEFIANDYLPLYKLDAGLMEQVLHNLLHNSIQYTPANSKIRIEVEPSSAALILLISDNGKGFPVFELEKVFEKFYRLPNSKAGGTGLGLSIVKGFVEAHKGKITLENNQGNGCTYKIEIPTEVSFLTNINNE